MAAEVELPDVWPPVLKKVPGTQTTGLVRLLLDAAMERGVGACFAVNGASMLPSIRPGDVVYVRDTTESRLCTGDVVVVHASWDEGLLVHRVVYVRDSRFRLRGDNSPRGDGWYQHEELVGLVTRVERDGKSVWFGSGRLGWLIAFAVRHGVVWRFNRVYSGLHRRVGRRLKFASADTRLRQRKGYEGNE